MHHHQCHHPYHPLMPMPMPMSWPSPEARPNNAPDETSKKHTQSQGINSKPTIQKTLKGKK